MLALVAQRLSLMPAVATYKWQHQLAVYDAAREESLLEQLALRAAALGIDAEAARALFGVQMRLARGVQERTITRLRERGLQGAPVSDLQTELRPRLDRISGQLLEAIAVALPALQAPGLAERYAAEGARVLAAVGLDAREAEELVAALGELRAAELPATKRVLARKVLRVGTTGDYAPFSAEAKGALTGVDVALVQGFARSLGVSVRFVRTSWPALRADLQRGAFDLAASGISVTPERRAAGRFSVPYHRGGKTAIGRCEERAQLDTLSKIDRPTVRLIVNSGGTNEAFARAQLTHAALRVMSDNRAVFGELLAGRADAMITDDVEVALQTKLHPELCRTTRELFATSDKAWWTPPDSDLAQAADRWLAARLKDRTVARTLARALQEAR